MLFCILSPSHRPFACILLTGSDGVAAGAPDTVTPPLPGVLRLPLLAQGLGLCAVRSTGAGDYGGCARTRMCVMNRRGGAVQGLGLCTVRGSGSGVGDHGDCTRCSARTGAAGLWRLHDGSASLQCSFALPLPLSAMPQPPAHSPLLFTAPPFLWSTPASPQPFFNPAPIPSPVRTCPNPMGKVQLVAIHCEMVKTPQLPSATSSFPSLLLPC